MGRAEWRVSVLGGGIALLAATRLRGVLRAVPLLIGTELIKRGVTAHSYLYGATGIDAGTERAPIRSERTVTIARPREELYRAWRNVENFPKFMKNLIEVKENGNRTHWVAEGPGGVPVEWETEITDEREPERIAWRTVQGSPLSMDGHILFITAPGDKGTEVKVVLQYRIPGGPLGRVFAMMFGKDPDQQSKENLRRFKQFMETGEVPTGEMLRHRTAA